MRLLFRGLLFGLLCICLQMSYAKRVVSQDLIEYDNNVELDKSLLEDIDLQESLPIVSQLHHDNKAISLDINSELHKSVLEDIDLEESSKLHHEVKINFNKSFLAFQLDNLEGKIQITFKPESFFARNVNLLNNNNEFDQTYLSRHTIDTKIGLKYGQDCYGFIATEFFMTLRNKATWGNPESIAQTTETETKILESVQAPHKHFLTKNIPWIREIWLKLSINAAFGLSFENQHFFTLGAFPFDLGRGIALGSAYAVNPGVLGFYSDNSIDQFAYGFKFSGNIFHNLTYDVYAAILENKADSLTATAAKIRGQEYGRRYKQERGAGHVNYLVATRFKWIPLETDCNLISLEPYALYNNIPEQKIEFPADSSAQLGTLGYAGEFKHGNLEFGFDTACNVGGQHVKGWDRNRVDDEDRAGVLTFINTRVVDQTGAKVVYDPNSVTGKQIKKIIENSAQDQSQNGLLIGQVGTTELFNDINRFTNPYNNKFNGWMAVADAGYWTFNKQVRTSIMVGAASGDENPNKDLNDLNESNQDKKFNGFIPLQEMYTGDRVQSALILGPSKVPRPLSSPTSQEALDALPSLVSGFTNLVFVGGSCLWTPKGYARKVNVKPNILFFWQEHATKKFDIITKMSSTEFARKRLGTEINLFADVELLKDLKMFAVGAVFVPGPHYADIKGKPLNKDQQRILDVLDVTGVDTDNAPLLSDNTAFSINIGLEYRF